MGKQALSCSTGDSLTWYDICGGQLGNVCEKLLKIYIHSKSIILLLEISPIKKFTWVHVYVHEKIFTEALFVMAKIMEDKFVNKGMIR